ncbi:MAG: hypothetical protein N3F63_04445 [Thermoplasmata archaeon]|nr:hypothetical protein [Thermoplasmata archaeon]
MTEITEGFCRAGVLQTDLEYIKKKKGNEGLNKLDKVLKGMGISLPNIQSMRSRDNVPLWMRCKFLDACLEVFDGNIEKIREMGREAPKASMLIKMLYPFHLSPNYALTHASRVWRDHYSAGELVILESSSCHALLALKNFRTTKLMCIFFAGAFVGVGDLTKAKNLVCTEVKCVNEGHEWCEYAFKWDI